MGLWLITDRTRPAWTAVHHLLSDGQWHPTAEVANAMRMASELAPRTIENHLRSASARRWINQRRGRVRIRDDFHDALDGDTQ